MLHFFWTGYSLSEKSYRIYESANFEIAKWAEKCLGEKVAFHQSVMTAGRVTESPDDILIGHLTWDPRPPPVREAKGALVHNWIRDNALSPDQPCHPNTYVLFPWLPVFPNEWTANMPFWQEQLRAAPTIFAICGEFWVERTRALPDMSIQKEVVDKLVRCNMGLAAGNFPIVKERFNKVGERHILHISNLFGCKGFDVTCKSLAGLNTQLHVATGNREAPTGSVTMDIAGDTFAFDHLGFVDNSDPVFNRWVVDRCDFYIHTSTMDAQATVILENCARGLVPLVTPESGFSSPHAIYLTHDPVENRKIIQHALALPEEELMRRSYLIRAQIARDHSWESIFDRIWDRIQNDVARKRSLSRA